MSESRNSEKNGATKTSREARRERWRGVVAEQRSSGESKAGFCRGRGISYKSFLYWARRFAEEGEPGRRAERFHEMRVGASGVFAFPVAEAVYEIAAGGVVVRVGSGFDEGEVVRLLRAVFEASRSTVNSTGPVGEATRPC